MVSMQSVGGLERFRQHSCIVILYGVVSRVSASTLRKGGVIVCLVVSIIGIVASALGAFGGVGTVGFVTGMSIFSVTLVAGWILAGVLCFYCEGFCPSKGPGQKERAVLNNFVETVKSNKMMSMKTFGDFLYLSDMQFRVILSNNWSFWSKDILNRACGHQCAKILCANFFKEIFHSDVIFVSPDPFPLDVHQDKEIQLDGEVFQLRVVQSVSLEIKALLGNTVGKEPGIHLFQLESGYNGAKNWDSQCQEGEPLRGKRVMAPVGLSPPPRPNPDEEKYPVLPHRRNFKQFEAANCCFTHVGFNMLDAVLRGSSTLKEDSILYGGCLEIDSSNIDQVIEALTARYDRIEFPCFGVRDPNEWNVPDGEQKDINVYFMLQAAPDFTATLSHSEVDQGKADVVQKFMSFASYYAILKQALVFSQEVSKKAQPITVHLTALGAVGKNNKPQNLCWGLKEAAFRCQDDLNKAKVKVKVNLEVLSESDGVADMGKILGLKE